MIGIPYLVKARINGETASNIILVTPEFEKDASKDSFREAMRASVAYLVIEKYGKDAEYDLTWERFDAEPIALS